MVALADAEYKRQREVIESLNRQRDMLVKKRTQLIRSIAEKANANDDNARIVKYAAMSIEVLREFKSRLQFEKVAKLSSTATSCFQALVLLTVRSPVNWPLAGTWSQSWPYGTNPDGPLGCQ